MLADPGVDTVIIATPVNTHYDLAAQALQAGKHVFVEKPLAPSSALADDLAQMASDRGLQLMCGHTFVYSPPVRAIKRMLESDTLGDIYFISSSRVNLGLHQRDVSVIWDLGPHDFSILLYWLSEMPTSVRAVGRDSIVPGIADVAFVTLTFASGIVANVELSWLAPSKLRRTVLVGSKRMVTYDDGAIEPVRVFDSGVVYKDPETFGEYHLSYRSGDIVSPKIESHEPLEPRARGFPPGCPLRRVHAIPYCAGPQRRADRRSGRSVPSSGRSRGLAGVWRDQRSAERTAGARARLTESGERPAAPLGSRARLPLSRNACAWPGRVVRGTGGRVPRAVLTPASGALS